MSKRAIIIPVAILIVAALLFFGISRRWTSWEGGSAEQKTDDAYLRADLVPLSTRISGTVRKMDVEDFQSVKAGQPLVSSTMKTTGPSWNRPRRCRLISPRQEAKIDSRAGPDLEYHAKGFSIGVIFEETGVNSPSPPSV